MCLAYICHICSIYLAVQEAEQSDKFAASSCQVKGRLTFFLYFFLLFLRLFCWGIYLIPDGPARTKYIPGAPTSWRNLLGARVGHSAQMFLWHCTALHFTALHCSELQYFISHLIKITKFWDVDLDFAYISLVQDKKNTNCHFG